MRKEKINEVKEILNDYELELLILFGSYEKENFNENSDLDLVLLNHADPLIKFKIASEGKLLYQSEKNLFEKFQVRAAAEHNDARKFYQLDKKFIEDFLDRSQDNDRSTNRAPEVK